MPDDQAKPDQQGVIKNVATLDLRGMTREDLAKIKHIENVANVLVPESLQGAFASICKENVANIFTIPEGDHVICGVPMLDLRGMTEQDIEKIDAIAAVGLVIVPEPLRGALARVRQEAVGMIMPVPEGADVKMQAGQVTMSGDALGAEGQEDTVLIIVGQLVITSVVRKVTYKHLLVAGQVFVPKGSETALSSGITHFAGQIFYYAGDPHCVLGSERLGRRFFELVERPLSLLVIGSTAIEQNVTEDLIKRAIADIALVGLIQAPRSVVPILQLLAKNKVGQIQEVDDG